MNQAFKEKIISFIQTFLSTFLTVLGTLIVGTSPETFANPQAWQISSIVAVIDAAFRTALKLTWQKTMPVSIGGVKKK